MATISSAGVGSGLDINSLVNQLVSAERASRDKRLARDETRLTTQFSALAALKGSMSGLQAALTALRGSTGLGVNKATVGDEQYFTASATGEAVAGSYDVKVEQLATAARLGSGVYPAGPDTTVGTGTLEFTVGTNSFSVDIDTSNDSLAQIRDAINEATGNSSVRATLIHDADGSYLVLTGLATGEANDIALSATGADAGLQLFVDALNAVDPGKDVVAQDAIVHVSGYEIHSATNAISGAVDGVTLNLKKATPNGDSVALTVARDDAAIQKKVESFVATYNTLAQQVRTLGRYDAATRTAGPMLGDSLLRGVDSQLRRMLAEPVAGSTGSYRTLSSLGIAVTATGALQLDATKFRQALAADPDAVDHIFTSDGGVAERMGAFIDERLATGGEFATRDARIVDQRRKLEQEKIALETRMVTIQQRYLRQFTAMDSMLAQLQTTSSYLTQQLGSLPGANSSGS